jgi:hypothetical protein
MVAASHQELRRRAAREAAVRPDGVVVAPPALDQLAGVREAEEPLLVEALVPQPAVEALHVRVLHRLAGADELEADAAALRPGQEGAARELRAVVAHDPRGQRPPPGEAVQRLGDATARQRGVDRDQRALAREVIHDREAAEHAPVGERVVHEVHRPALARPRRHVRRHAGGAAARATAAAPAKRELLLTVQPLRALVAPHEPFT